MPLTKQVVVDQITILEEGQLQVRTATRVLEDGVLLGETYHRKVIEPGDVLTAEDARVRDVGNAVHTPAVVAKWRARPPKGAQ